MAERKTVGIKELKNKLSAYLREVRRGTRILVADRSTIIAEIHEPGASYAPADRPEAVLARWAAAGRVTLPADETTPVEPGPGLRLPAGTALRLLDRDRRDSGR